MKDWKGNYLQDTDDVYLTEDGLVKEEDFAEYYGLTMPSPIKVFEYKEMLVKKERK